MCTYNLILDSKLTEKTRNAVVDDGQDNTFEQQTMVKKSLTKAFRELHSGKARKNARNLFT